MEDGNYITVGVGDVVLMVNGERLLVQAIFPADGTFRGVATYRLDSIQAIKYDASTDRYYD